MIYCLRAHGGPHDCACCHAAAEEWEVWQPVRDMIAAQLARQLLGPL